MAETPQNLQTHSYILHAYCKRRTFKDNVSKTKILCFLADVNLHFDFENQKIEIVLVFLIPKTVNYKKALKSLKRNKSDVRDKI